jgi:hypothetical protein
MATLLRAPWHRRGRVEPRPPETSKPAADVAAPADAPAQPKPAAEATPPVPAPAPQSSPPTATTTAGEPSAPPVPPKPARRGKHRAIQAAVAFFVIAALAAGYLAALHITLVTPADADVDIEERDSIYFAIHGAGLLVAPVVGFALGKWLNGLGFAYAALFFVTLFALMAAAQVGSQALACSAGENDLIRHWTC